MIRTVLRNVLWPAFLASLACTLDLTAPLVPPPDRWDPALNTHPRGGAFQELLDEYVQRGLPGVVLLVRTPEGLWNGAGGYARLESRAPMTPAHRFHAASVTKMYMATAIMLLVEDGVVGLDAPIRTYLPPEVWRPIPNGGEATVRQLLDHRSGIPDFSGDLRYDMDFLNDPLGAYPPERILGYLHGQSAWMAPGSGYFYSNANYFLLAMIADEVAGTGRISGAGQVLGDAQLTGAGHADLIDRRILRPLGLTGTYYRNDESYPRPPGLVNSYQDLAGDGRLMNVSDLATHAATIFFGNAGLVATSADFAAFLDALMDGEIVSPETVSLMTERPTPSSLYGLGVSLMDTNFGVAMGHSGGDMGALAQVRYFPDRDATLVLLSNGGDGGVPDRLFSALWEEAMEMALGGG